MLSSQELAELHHCRIDSAAHTHHAVVVAGHSLGRSVRHSSVGPDTLPQMVDLDTAPGQDPGGQDKAQSMAADRKRYSRPVVGQGVQGCCSAPMGNHLVGRG